MNGTEEKKYHKVGEVAKITGLSRTTVLDYCHARGQKFAFKPKGNTSPYLIDLPKFILYVERNRSYM